LLAPTLDELLGSDHFVRRLLPLVEGALGEDLRRVCNDRGGYRHDPVGLFCVWTYGFLQGEASSRKLEEKCRYDARYAFLCSGTTPDHSTLSRFRDSLSDVLDALLARLALEAQRAGLLGSRPLALDGTKVPASSTQWRRALDRSREEDAAFLRRPNGDGLFGYNVQAMTDLGSGYAAAYAVTSAANDAPGAEAALAALEAQSPVRPDAVVADKGFDAPEVYEAIESRGMVAVVAQKGARRHFLSLGDDGVYRCPAGHEPRVRDALQDGKPVRVWQVSRCSGCAFGRSCGASGRQKRAVMPVGVLPGHRRAWQASAESESGRRLLRARAPSIERLFGTLKGTMGLRRFKLRHAKGARLEFGLAILAYNLRMLAKELRRKLFRLLGRREPIIGNTRIELVQSH